MRAAFVLAALLTQALSVQCMTWKSCGDNSAVFTPSIVTLNPDPPVSGKDITFTISGQNEGGAWSSWFLCLDSGSARWQRKLRVGVTASSIRLALPLELLVRCILSSLQPVRACDAGITVPSGKLEVNVIFMGTPIFQTEWDLCHKTACPITPGPVDIEYKQNLPPIAPPVRPPRGHRPWSPSHWIAWIQSVFQQLEGKWYLLLQGPYEVKLVARGANNEELMCLLVDFEIQAGWFSRKML